MIEESEEGGYEAKALGHSIFTEAENLFTDAIKQDFTAQELNKIYFRPPNFEDYKKPLRLKSKVVRVKAGYSIIQPEGYPAFLCPASKWNNLFMQEGLLVTIEPGFTPKARLAINPMVV